MTAMKCNRCSKTLLGNSYQDHWKFCLKRQVKVKKTKQGQSKVYINLDYSGKKQSKKKLLKDEVNRLNRLLLKTNEENKRLKNNVKPERKFHPVYDSIQWKNLRYYILKKFNFKCLACNTNNSELHVDHIKPISKYPELTFDENNLQVLCKDCNMSKSNKFEDDLRNK
jgi:5-methylcytosine-specific restriction endonuclease McrA